MNWKYFSIFVYLFFATQILMDQVRIKRLKEDLAISRENYRIETYRLDEELYKRDHEYNMQSARHEYTLDAIKSYKLALKKCRNKNKRCLLFK